MCDNKVIGDVRRLVELRTVDEFEWIHGIHITTLIGFGAHQFNPLHQKCIENQNGDCKNNQPPVFTNHCVIPRENRQ